MRGNLSVISWFGGVVPVYSGAVVWSPLLIVLPNTILEGEDSYGWLPLRQDDLQDEGEAI